MLMRIRTKIKDLEGFDERRKGTWVAVVVGVVGAIGGGLSAYGSYASGQAAKRANLYNSKATQAQARIQAAIASAQDTLQKRTAESNITVVQNQAAEATKANRRSMALLEGEQKGVLAANGIGGGSVTAADIAADTFDIGQLDREAIKYNADSKSWAIKNDMDITSWNLNTQGEVDQFNLKTQSDQYKMAGKNAAAAGNTNAISTLLSTASTTAATGAKIYQNSKAGK